MANPGRRCIVEGCHQRAVGYVAISPPDVVEFLVAHSENTSVVESQTPTCAKHGLAIHTSGGRGWRLVQDLERPDVVRLVPDDDGSG